MEYKTQEYLEDLAKYISKEVRKAPQITLEELTVKRNKLMTEHKCEAFRLQGTHVTWYGTPTKISLSGDFRFNRTDERGNLINSDHWFWALVSDLHDKNKIDSIYNLLQERPEAAYRIVGRRDLNDCDYYPEDNPLIGTCIEVMVIDSIDLINP